MSEFTDHIIDAVAKSHFNFLDGNRTLEVTDAVLFWKNFEGKPNKFGTCRRNFNLAVSTEAGEALKKMNFRVNDLVDKEDEKTVLFQFINVKVNMESAYPPIVTVFTDFNGRRSHTAISIETIGTLDKVSIQSADCTINIYSSAKNPGHPSGYLKKLNIIQNKMVEFGGKYDGWDNDPTPADATPEEEPDQQIDGADMPQKDIKK